jgi:hypothetical protein
VKFSERMGIIAPRSVVQVSDMDAALRNGIWNVLLAAPLANASNNIPAREHPLPYRRLWDEFFHLPVDSMPYSSHEALGELRSWYFDAAWHQVYDLAQFLVDFQSDQDGWSGRPGRSPIPSPRKQLVARLNALLERELSGFRFVAGHLVPISDEQQMTAIEVALKDSTAGAYRAAHVHLSAAISLLADRATPSYRNVIKEAISAVESIAKVIGPDPKATLGEALKRIDSSFKIHPSLNIGFQKIYGYTSDADGIRHALMEADSLEQEDALFMLVSCAAFVSYLIAKARRLEIAV